MGIYDGLEGCIGKEEWKLELLGHLAFSWRQLILLRRFYNILNEAVLYKDEPSNAPCKCRSQLHQVVTYGVASQNQSRNILYRALALHDCRKGLVSRASAKSFTGIISKKGCPQIVRSAYQRSKLSPNKVDTW